MDVIPSNGVYALMMLFGAVSVAIHAYELYGTSLDTRAVPHRSVLLDGLPLATLVGTRSFNRGFLCYLAIVLFLFLMLCFSSVILELSLSVVDLQGSIGALERGGSAVNPLTPILASSIVITGSRARPLSQIEKAIRRLAHRAAGLPDGVYELTGRVAQFGFDLSEAELGEATPSVRDAHALADTIGERAREALPAGDAQGIATDVRRVYTLRALTIGPDGDGLWDERSRVELRDTLTIARTAFRRLDDRLRAVETRGGERGASAAPIGAPVASVALANTAIGVPFVSRGDTSLAEAGADVAVPPRAHPAPASTAEADGVGAGDANAWHELGADVERLVDDFSMLFTLLVTNQSQVRVPEGADQLRGLLGALQRREPSRETDALFGSVLGGLFAGLLLAALYYAIERPLGDAAAALTAMGAGVPDTVPPGEGATPGGVDGPADVEDAASFLARAYGASGGLFALFSDGLRRAFGSVLPLGIVFAVAAATALGLRAASDSALQWTPWRPGAERLPVRQYVSVALTSTLMAFLFYTLYVFTLLVVLPSLALERTWLSPSLLRDFADYFPALAPLPLVGAVCAMAVCLLADAGPGDDGTGHGRFPHARRALVFAALCGLVGVVGRLLAGSVGLRAALEALLVPLLTLWPCFLVFAALFARRAPARTGP